MKQKLIGMLADYLRISTAEAERRFAQSSICASLSDEHTNLRYQPVEYVFNLLKQEVADEDIDDYDATFERPESMPEGPFVRSH